MVQEASVIPGVHWSRGDRRAITLAAAFCARCSGAMVDLGRPASIALLKVVAGRLGVNSKYDCRIQHRI